MNGENTIELTDNGFADAYNLGFEAGNEYRRANAAEKERDKWKAKAEEAERAMNAAAGKWARADEENRELRKMLLLDDGTVEEYTERADPLTALAHQKQLAEEWRDRCHNAEALCGKLEAERDEKVSLLETAFKRCGELETERDEWKAKAKSILNAESYKFASEPDAESYIDCGKVENDSREKLEADIHRAADEIEKFTYGEKFINTNKILRWLDRQAAITEREVGGTLLRQDEQIAELTAERDALANDLLTCNKEREEYREKLSEVLDLIYRAYNVGSGAYD